jgi:hypothetical protein
MKNSRFLIFFLLLAFALPYTYGGCSGGGGSDGDSGLVYSGLTNPAVLTDSNGKDISGGAFGAGLLGDDMSEGLPGSSLNQGSTAYHTKNLRSVQVPLILSDSLELIDFTSSTSGSVQAAAQSETATIDDGCGGSMSYTVTFDDVTGSFSGSFIFSDYGCDGTTISGRASFSGIIDVNTLDFIEADFSFYNLSGGELTLDGDLSIDYTVTPHVITFNAYGQDPNSGKVFWISNYSITIDDDMVSMEIVMSGRFFHPDHGYVTLSTVDPFVSNDGDEWPNDGTLVVIGANNSKVKLTALSNLTCSVDVDVDGDGVYELLSGVMNWENL